MPQDTSAAGPSALGTGPLGDGVQPWLFYHQEIFGYLGETYRDRLQKALHEDPLKLRRSRFLASIPPGETLSGEAAWQRCDEYLRAIEDGMAAVLRRHSVFFWMHLYRRIGVELGPEHENKTDANTLGLVRGIVELAITRFGDTARADDVAQSSRIKAKDVLGGHYQRVLRKQWVDVAERFKALAASNQWVITHFEQRDFFDIYLAEGLAYEYWRTTAMMRAIGKGSGYRWDGKSDVEYVESRELVDLMLSYDERIDSMPLSTALVGSWFHPTPTPAGLGRDMVVPYYNVERRDGLGALKAFGIRAPTGGTFVSNFQLARIDLATFREAHLFLAAAFRKATGVSLDALIACLWGLSNVLLLPSRIMFGDRKPGDDLTVPLAKNVFNVIQRGYTTFVGGQRELAAEILFRAECFEPNLPMPAEGEVVAALEWLTLTPAKQQQVGLWSGGRRFLLVPFGDATVIDLQGVPSVLTTLFVRVQHEQTERGTVFEEAFRAALPREGFDLAQVGDVYASDGKHREIDASVRIGDTLVLFECRSIERPLDFEIGRIRTMGRRQELLAEKIEQALSLRQFVIDYPVGRNYDFSWATEVLAFVVSPFVEWIWSRDSRLWHDPRTPRILKADEAIAFLRARKK